MINYHPHLSTWNAERIAAPSNLKSNSFKIASRNGASVATVNVNPNLDEADAQKVSDLMAASPELMRHLQHTLPFLVDSVSDDDADRFLEILRLIWHTIERFPFGFLRPDSDDEINARRTREAEDALLEGGAA